MKPTDGTNIPNIRTERTETNETHQQKNVYEIYEQEQPLIMDVRGSQSVCNDDVS